MKIITINLDKEKEIGDLIWSGSNNKYILLDKNNLTLHPFLDSSITQQFLIVKKDDFILNNNDLIIDLIDYEIYIYNGIIGDDIVPEKIIASYPHIEGTEKIHIETVKEWIKNDCPSDVEVLYKDNNSGDFLRAEGYIICKFESKRNLKEMEQINCSTCEFRDKNIIGLCSHPKGSIKCHNNAGYIQYKKEKVDKEFNTPPCEKCVSYPTNMEKEPCLNCDENYSAFKDKELELIQKAGFKLLNQSEAEIKAEELINKFVALNHDIFCNVNYPYSKQCAIICVEEILTANPHSNPLNTDVYSTFEFWKEVLQILKSK